MDAAWVAAGGVLIGSIATGALNMLAEARRAMRDAAEHEQQRAHELAVRELELRAQHRAALYADRRSAYVALGQGHRRFERARMACTFDRLEAERLGPNAGGSESHRAAVADYQQAGRAMEDALVLVQVVASSEVASAARHLQGLIIERADDESIPQETWDIDEWQARWREIEVAEDALQAAIRGELELDR